MSHDEIEGKVRDIVARFAKQQAAADLPADGDLYRDLGVRSTAALDLLLSLEDEFGVSVPDDRFGDARTVGALVALVQELK
jgi:acyl carrier protein